ncbi:hypothetical protein K440DRAFT_641439 [Wilcoxina mikolae CBS 423.85]|nr:hypothetical protein K440DRAFT_641439 [Wilcoxina mikolae CBS 423.85]
MDEEDPSVRSSTLQSSPPNEIISGLDEEDPSIRTSTLQPGIEPPVFQVPIPTRDTRPRISFPIKLSFDMIAFLPDRSLVNFGLCCRTIWTYTRTSIQKRQIQAQETVLNYYGINQYSPRESRSWTYDVLINLIGSGNDGNIHTAQYLLRSRRHMFRDMNGLIEVFEYTVKGGFVGMAIPLLNYYTTMVSPGVPGTLLHCAVQGEALGPDSQVEILRNLLDCGWMVNTRRRADGATPLFLTLVAMMCNFPDLKVRKYIKVAEFLLLRGARTNMLNWKIRNCVKTELNSGDEDEECAHCVHRDQLKNYKKVLRTVPEVKNLVLGTTVSRILRSQGIFNCPYHHSDRRGFGESFSPVDVLKIFGYDVLLPFDWRSEFCHDEPIDWMGFHNDKQVRFSDEAPRWTIGPESNWSLGVDFFGLTFD